MRELSAREVMLISGGEHSEGSTCTWDVVVGYVGATVSLTMVTGPIGFAFASVMWAAAATSMQNNC